MDNKIQCKKMFSEDEINQFNSIIEDKNIKTVFQPIVSLKNGDIMGYEALSRISCDSNISIGQMFSMAEYLGKLWKLEKLCRKKAIESAVYLPKGKYLFINVDANIILDREFKSGTTRKYLDKYNLKPENVVFEITERTDVDNQEILRQVIEHYKNQGFAIAIDDVGSGYSGLNRINSLTPHYLKLDYELVHNVNESKSQKSLVELIVKYCRDMGYKAIAEGIETEEELKCLVGLGVDYGQGFLLSKPEESFAKGISDKNVLDIINSGYQKRRKKNSVGAISKMGIVLSPDDLVFKAYSMFVRDRELNYISIVDNKNKFIGYIKRDFYERNCWYNIEKSEKHINEYMDTKEALLVPDSMPQIDALKKAMKRKENVYDPVVVTKRGRFQGNIEIKTLVAGLLN